MYFLGPVLQIAQRCITVCVPVYDQKCRPRYQNFPIFLGFPSFSPLPRRHCAIYAGNSRQCVTHLIFLVFGENPFWSLRLETGCRAHFSINLILVFFFFARTWLFQHTRVVSNRRIYPYIVNMGCPFMWEFQILRHQSHQIHCVCDLHINTHFSRQCQPQPHFPTQQENSRKYYGCEYAKNSLSI